MNYEQFQHNEQNIFLVDMRNEQHHHFSELFENAIEKYLRLWKKIGIIINKRGYAQGLLCRKCGYIPQCDKCSVSITYHKQINGEMMGLCHICKTQYTYHLTCPKCGSEKFGFFGMGIEQLSEILETKYQKHPMIIDSWTTNTPNKIKKILETIHTTKPQLIIGTSLLAQPIFDYAFDLIIFLNADIGLNIPDYTANENNFLLLYETFKKHQTKNFIVQTFNPDHYSIRNACKLDFQGFYDQENIFRQECKYPPFSELCIILYKDEIESRMYTKVNKLYQELLYLSEKYQIQDLEIYTTPPLIYKMFGKFRYNIILKWKYVRNFMDIVISRLPIQEQWFKIHWDAESIV